MRLLKRFPRVPRVLVGQLALLAALMWTVLRICSAILTVVVGIW